MSLSFEEKVKIVSLITSFPLFRFLCPSPFLHAQLLSRVRPFATPWQTVACQAPLFMEFSRQEHWNGLPCPPPGDCPDPGIKPKSLVSPALAGDFFNTSAIWEAPVQLQPLWLSKIYPFMILHTYVSQVKLMVKNLPAIQETGFDLHWEDPLEKRMTTYSNILAWRISWREEPGGLQSMGHEDSDTTEHIHWLSFSHSVLSDSLRPHGLQHARLPCPAPSPEARSDSGSMN